MSQQLKYAPIDSVVDSSFFSKLSELKLNEFKLSSSITRIEGAITQPQSLTKFIDKPKLSLDYASFEENTDDKNNLWVQGHLQNVNTIEEFKNVDKQAFLKEAGLAIYEKIKGYKDIPNFKEINPFSLLTFSDLKKYKFYYWFAYPALVSTWLKESETEVEYEFDTGANSSSNLFFASKDGVPVSFVENFSNEFVFIDTSVNELPSVQLRNYLYFLALKGYKSISLIVHKRFGKSRKLQLKLDESSFDETVAPKILGWERTAQGKLGPKVADLGSLINPSQLAEQAVDLNLKLMKWRIAPNINLDIIKTQKVLLLGAGTLGSYVARALMGWGVRKITFVDSGRISYSNPVRQPLFSFKDCYSDQGRGEWKAHRAAAALKEIFPGVESEGYNLEVPMVGHPISSEDEQRQRQNFEKLEELYDSHDVIFLLMDSRESRWLPTVLGLAKGKTVLNAALGFDSYLVMRHGSLSSDTNEDYEGRLGCYYCNDVVAPDDSLTDRTLDQMCTVTRPGGALIASALAVELLVSILQHPLGRNAPSTTDSKEDPGSNIGEVPHQIRGFLHSFQQTKLMSPSFTSCSACSMAVINEYKNEGWEFVKHCLNDSKYLEEVSGLKKVQEDAELGVEELLKDLEFSDEDEEWLT